MKRFEKKHPRAIRWFHWINIGTIHFTDQRPSDYRAERCYDWYGGH